jgi:hypothetical protein
MTPRQEFIAEVWKEESRATGVRLIELDKKCEDCGLTVDEAFEYAALKEKNSQLLMKLLNDLEDVRTA